MIKSKGAIPRRDKAVRQSVHREVSDILYERRLLTFVTGLAGLGVLAWLVALSTDYWIIVVPDADRLLEEQGVSLLNVTGDGKLLLWSHSGLWKCCVVYKVRLEMRHLKLTTSK